MRKGFPVLLVLLATVTHQAVAITGSDQTLVNDYNAPVRLHGERLNYQLQDIQRQKTNQPSNASTQKVATLIQDAETTTNIKPGSALDTTLFNTSTQTDSTLTSVLEVFGLGAGIGINGMLSGDYNNDGVTKLVLGNPTSIVFAQTIDGKFGLQSQLQFSAGIGKLAYFRDLSTDGHFAFFSHDGKLHKLDLITRQVKTSLDLAGVSSYRIQASSDLKSASLLVRTQSGLLNVIDPITLKIVSSQSGIDADIAALGSFTEKNSAQVLLTNGQIYDSKNNKLTLVKTLFEKNHAFTGAVDINGDGFDEVLAAEHWYLIKLYSPLKEEVLWSKKTALDTAVVIMADVDQDGQLDGVYGDGQWGGLHAFNLQTGEDFWDISNPEHGVTNIVIADLNNDGKQDIGWGAGYSSSGADYLFIHDIASKDKIWQSEDIQFPISAVSLIDVDQDGDLDLVSASAQSNSGYNGGILQVFDIKSKSRLWHGYAAADNWGRTMNLVATDLDNDGTIELVIGASQIYTGMVRVLDAADGSERFKILLGDGDAVSSLTTADLNQDGFREIIVGNNAVHTGSVGVFFRVLNGRTGQVIQQSPSLGFYWQGLTDLTPIELNGNWFVYGLLDGNLHQYNFSNNSVKQLTNVGRYQQLTSVVIEGATELAVTDQQGKIFRLAANGNVIANATVCNSAVTGLSSAGPDRVLFTCNNSLNEYNLTTQSSVYSHATGFTTLGDPKL
ncbi:MAG: hypothetical protein KKA56_16950, partial [Gammaproteobacteria bacterium]|nr:hypothetical protein [Gammaproteobacteria bacterium]